jgi:hypothetical protein
MCPHAGSVTSRAPSIGLGELRAVARAVIRSAVRSSRSRFGQQLSPPGFPGLDMDIRRLTVPAAQDLGLGQPGKTPPVASKHIDGVVSANAFEHNQPRLLKTWRDSPKTQKADANRVRGPLSLIVSWRSRSRFAYSATGARASRSCARAGAPEMLAWGQHPPVPIEEIAYGAGLRDQASRPSVPRAAMPGTISSRAPFSGMVEVGQSAALCDRPRAGALRFLAAGILFEPGAA